MAEFVQELGFGGGVFGKGEVEDGDCAERHIVGYEESIDRGFLEIFRKDTDLTGRKC